MIKTSLGSTGILTSIAGLGTVKFGRNQNIRYPHSFELPSDDQIIDLLAFAKESGINLLDTAPSYGTSEERLGSLLKNRHEWVICTKVGEEFVDGHSFYDFSPDSARNSVDRSLKRLRTDYLDIVLVHSNGDDVKIINETGIFSTLAELKKSGLIRAYGMSTKTVEGGLLAVDLADVVMVTLNPIQTDDQAVIAHAHEKGKGVFIKKALASGHLDKIAASDPVQCAMDFVFKCEGVSSVILGTLNKGHLRHNIQAILGSNPANG